LQLTLITEVNRVSAVMVYFRQSDVQTSDILPLSPALIRDHQPVIMDVFKAGLRHAIVRLDTRSDLSVKVYVHLLSEFGVSQLY
jgi:hypothetical protein